MQQSDTKKSPTDIIKDIDKLAKDIFGSLENPETLSMTIVELAVLNVGMGNWLADALEAERNLDTELKYLKQKHITEGRKQDGKKAIGALEAEAVVNTKEKQDELLEIQHAVQLYKIKRSDTEKLIDATRSRLSIIKQDIKGE